MTMKQPKYGTQFLALLLAAIFLCSQAQAKDGEIFRGRAADGSVIFSDQPLPGADSIQVKTTQTIPALESKPSETASAEENGKVDQASGYKQLAIVSPANDEAIRDNSGTVTVTYVSTPPLNEKKGHSLRILLDGKSVPVPPGKMGVSLNNVDRGNHELTGEITSYDGEVLIQSEKTTFHLRRFSNLFKKKTTN